MKNIKHILERLREVYKVPNNRQLSTKIEVNYNTMATWIKRDIVPYEKLHELVQKENISFDWLLNGVGEKYLNSEISTQKPIKSKEDNRDSEDLPYVLLFDEFEKMPNNPSMKLILNKPKKIYTDNQLFKLLNVNKDVVNIDKVICVDNIIYNNQHLVNKYYFSDNIDNDKYLNMLTIGDNDIAFYIIIKNNLLEKNYPLYEDKYLGIEGSIYKSSDNKRIVFKTHSYIDDILHSSEIQLTKDEFKNLKIFAYDMMY